MFADGLAKYLPILISVAQSAFIKERSIVKNFLSAHEVLAYCRRSGHKGMLCKLDFETTFDSINQNFLFDIM